HPALASGGIQSGVCARYRGMRLYAAWSAEKTARVLREGVRACAVSNFLVTGRFEIPAGAQDTVVAVDHKTNYLAMVEEAKKAKAIDPKIAAQVADWGGFNDSRGYTVLFSLTEAHLESDLFIYATNNGDIQAPLEAGHDNWVS